MKYNLYRCWIILFSSFILIQCTNKTPEVFQLLNDGSTGITFNNEIPESDSLNIIINNYIYNGAGVGIADFDNDSLPDVFFAGNLVNNQLYLNQGDLQFKDISKLAGIEAAGKWVSGVNIVDINNDGWQDIYLTCTFHKDSILRNNVLLIHQGLNVDGMPTFKDKAEAYGLADNRYTTHSIFLDYDIDGDLDLFLINNKLDLPKTMGLHKKVNDGSSLSTDRLYRNNGDQTFTNVSTEAGITHHGFGLGVAVFDINEDNYPDIYVSNDFVSNDILWINQKDGTFKNEIKNYVDHQSFSSMGNNVGDFNNDGLPEIVTLDMLPEKDERMKMMFGGSNHYYYEIMQQKDYEIQYPRNMVQLNQGNGHFSDIGMMLDIDATDWSWSPIICDFDNDGRNDLFITNGFPRDITDLDFSDFHSGMNVLMSANNRLLSKIPVVKIENHLYLQKDELNFEKTHRGAAFSVPSFSNGAALSDLDRDGDMDLVVSNINDKAFIYKNQTADNSKEKPNNYIQIAIKGDKNNIGGIGTKVKITTDNGIFAQDVQFNRGYCSTSESLLHFGLGETEKINLLTITWTDNTETIIPNPTMNKVHYLDYKTAKKGKHTQENELPYFDTYQNEISNTAHAFKKFYDFNGQPQIQKLTSEEAPPVVVVDLNKDSLDDIILSQGNERPLLFYYQKKEGGFDLKTYPEIDSSGEVTTLLIVDLNGDGFEDLYIGKGSPEFFQQPYKQQDLVYLNQNGQGFIQDKSFQSNQSITGTTVAADFDKDGDIDLFVGSRVVAGKWPLTPSSALFINENGKLTDQIETYTKDLKKVGMVTSALWTDVNNDSWLDLMVVGKWMSPTIFINKEGKQLEKWNAPKLNKLQGLWNSVVAADLDNDGFIDYVLGNQGLNNKYRLDAQHPLKLYAKDFDENGSVDPIMSHFIDGAYKPYHLRNGIKKQLRSLSKDYKSYISYATSTTEQVLEKLDAKDVLVFEANLLDHIILWNEGGKAFSVQKLPLLTQVSVGNGILLEDIDNDRKLDILFTGNDYGTEVFNGIHDAGTGTFLLNEGDRNFKALAPAKTHFYNEGNTRGLVKYYDVLARQFIYLTNRHGNTPILQRPIKGLDNRKLITIPTNVQRINIQYPDGEKIMQEWYIGQGYKSQNSRKIYVQGDIQRITGITFKGKEVIIFE